ncbi:MAG: ankyrin repeat protein [Mycoplasmataceae bacterium CE_OT135]|nr:MAG: ankyrin repeat protein [Mycoplasmataceae bacterium CE_OT135]
MTKVQQYINKEYPKSNRNKVTKLDISNKDLEGKLVLELKEFPNLEELDCSNNLLTEITFTNPHKRTTRSSSSNKEPKLEWKIRKLNLANNNFAEQDLSFLEEFTELEELSIANNKIIGSLESLKSMTKLKRLDISDTDIDSGLEYLPENLEEINCSFGMREDSKVKNIERVLENCGIKKEQTNIWVISSVKELKAKLLSEKIHELCQAAENDDAETIKSVLATNQIIINLLDKNGNSSLHYAVSNENWEAIEVLLQNKANPDIQDVNGFTPLHLAAANSHRQIVKKLLKHKANPNFTDNKGNTPLHFAAEQNNLETLKLLVNNPWGKQKGNIDAVNKYNWSVLHGAALGIINEKEDWGIIEWLLKQGVDVNVEDNNGFSVHDVFSQKDWSYGVHYENLLQETKKTESKQLENPYIKEWK